MSGTIKKILFPFTLPASLRGLIRLTGQHAIFPLYHAAGDTIPGHLKHVQKVRSVKTFEKDLETMLMYYRPVSLQDYLLMDKSGKPDVMVLTFDDGLRECHEWIAPILRRKGVPAIFFLNNHFIDNRDLFFRYKASLLIEHYCRMDCASKEIEEIVGVEKRYIRQSLLKIGYDERSLLDNIAQSSGFSFDDYLANNPVYMSGEQVRSLIDDGFEIGSHSFDHPRFSHLPGDTIREQVVSSIEELSRQFGLKKRYFSFPFSSDGVPVDVIEALLTEDKVDAVLGTSGLKKGMHPGFIQRIPIEKFSWSAYRILKTEYLYYLLKAPFGKNRYPGG